MGTWTRPLCLGGNLFGSNPDAKFASQALGKLELIAYLSTSLNSGHAWGTAKETLILPVLPRDEEPQADDPGIDVQLRAAERRRPAHATRDREAKCRCCPRWAAACSVTDGPVNWSDLESHERIRALIAELIPGPRADGRHRPHAPRVSHRRPPPGHSAVPDRFRQSQVSRRCGCRRRRRRKSGSCG